MEATQFMSALGLDKEDESQHVAVLYGRRGRGSSCIHKHSQKKYKDVMAGLDGYFQVRKNLVYKRAKFNRRDQRDGELAITTLYELIETCEFGALHDEMLRDQLIVSIRNKSLSEKLQLDMALTLEKAKTTICQKEAVKEQSQQLTSQRPQDVTPRASHCSRGGANAQLRNTTGPNKCTRCGRRKHQGAEKCPARNAICKESGHFKACCFSKSSAVSAVASGDQADDAAFLGTLTTQLCGVAPFR